MRILFYCQYFPPEMGAPAARTHEHARRWVARGHDVTVVCGLPNHPDGKVPKAYRGHWVCRESVDGITVLRCWFFIAANRGVLRRCLSFLSFMVASFIVGIRQAGGCDVIVGTTPQLLCALGGYLVSRVKGKPFVLEVRDLWPKQIIDLGTIRNPMVIAGLERLEGYLYRRSRAVIAVTEASRRYIEGLGVPAQKLYTIHNGVDERLFTPQQGRQLRKLRGWSGKFVVLYIGTHGLSQGLDTILETAALLKRESRFHFVFVGSGAEQEKLRTKASSKALANTEFISHQPKSQMPAFYGAADVCLVPLKKRDVFRYNVPSKVFEIMACARPILLGATGQAQMLLEEAGAGIAVEPENAVAYRDGILYLADHVEEAAAFGRKGREHVLAHYTRDDLADDFLVCLERALDGRLAPGR